VRPASILTAVAIVGGSALLAPGAAAQSIQRTKDQPAENAATIPSTDKDPLRGSTFLFDQSMSTQTAHVEPSPQQSYVPFYGWWLSLRPRYNLDDHWSVRGRFDYYKEFTNSGDTALYREDVFGDIWTDVVYSRQLAESGRFKNTKVSFGARALWPTSKATQAQGVYVTLGATAGISQKIPIRGEDSPWLGSARVGLSMAYLHPFSQATTANDYGNFAYTRQNVEGFSFISDQLNGQTLSAHTLYGILDSGLQATKKLGLTLDFILINQWHYAPTQGVTVPISGGNAVVANPVNDQQFTQLGWFVLEADYDLLDELSLGLGYYNLANTISPDGQVRTLFGGGDNSLLWSPDARVYFDVTANLDKIFEDLTGRYKVQPGQTAQAARQLRAERLANGLR
jgi:hypothetical protein